MKYYMDDISNGHKDNRWRVQRRVREEGTGVKRVLWEGCVSEGEESTTQGRTYTTSLLVQRM